MDTMDTGLDVGSSMFDKKKPLRMPERAFADQESQHTPERPPRGDAYVQEHPPRAGEKASFIAPLDNTNVHVS